MELKKRTVLQKLLTSILLTALFICISLLAFSPNVYNVFAESSLDNIDEPESSDSDNGVEPYLFTSLTLGINGGNGEVWAIVKNDFTLFSSTVIVIVELYSSDTYYELYSDMNLVSINSTEDLDMNKTITAKASTGGRQMYWQGRMRYKENNKGWKSEVTGTILCSAEGAYLGML